MITKEILESAGLTRTYNPYKDDLALYKSLRIEGIMNDTLEKIITNAELLLEQPFLRLFACYGTNIGETLEEVLGKKFIEIIPKHLPGKPYKTGKPGKEIDNPIYTEYYKKHKLKPTNFDWLFQGIDGELYRLEVKVIRAAESKNKNKLLTSEKFYEIPSLLEERALTFAEGSGGNGTFQQTKPELFDYIMGIVIYADRVDFYLVPSIHINQEKNIRPDIEVIDGKKQKGISGHLILKPQHSKTQKNSNGTYKEGHLALSELNNAVDGYKILSVFSEDELLTKDTLSKYIK